MLGRTTISTFPISLLVCPMTISSGASHLICLFRYLLQGVTILPKTLINIFFKNVSFPRVLPCNAFNSLNLRLEFFLLIVCNFWGHLFQCLSLVLLFIVILLSSTESLNLYNYVFNLLLVLVEYVNSICLKNCNKIMWVFGKTSWVDFNVMLEQDADEKTRVTRMELE